MWTIGLGGLLDHARRAGLESLWFPIPDGTAPPDLDRVARLVGRILERLGAGRKRRGPPVTDRPSPTESTRTKADGSARRNDFGRAKKRIRASIARRFRATRPIARKEHGSPPAVARNRLRYSRRMRDGQLRNAERRRAVRRRSFLAQAAAQQLDPRTGERHRGRRKRPRVVDPAPGVADRRRERRDAHPARLQVLCPCASGDGARRGGQSAPGLGRSGSRL